MLYISKNVFDICNSWQSPWHLLCTGRDSASGHQKICESGPYWNIKVFAFIQFYPFFSKFKFMLKYSTTYLVIKINVSFCGITKGERAFCIKAMLSSFPNINSHLCVQSVSLVPRSNLGVTGRQQSRFLHKIQITKGIGAGSKCTVTKLWKADLQDNYC